MTVRWEIEPNYLRIEGDHATWTFKNAGDENAPPGSSLGTVTIVGVPDPDSATQPTPYTNAITPDRDVAPGTAHPMSYPLTWVSQEVGSYRIIVMPHDDVCTELSFRRTLYGVEHDH